MFDSLSLSLLSLPSLSLLPTSPYCYPPYLINAHLSTLLPPPPCRQQPRDHFRKSSPYTLPFVASCKQPPSSETNASAMAANYQRKSHHLKVSPWHAENLPSSSMQARPLPAFFCVQYNAGKLPGEEAIYTENYHIVGNFRGAQFSQIRTLQHFNFCRFTHGHAS